jgi:flagellar biosynthesis regulator FlaF
VRIGELLLPAITTGVQAFNELLAAALNFVESSRDTIKGWADSFASAMGTVGVMSRNLGSMWTITQLKIGEFAENSVRWFETIPANLRIILPWIGRNWQNMLIDLASAAAAIFTNILDNAWNFGQAVWAAIQGQPWQFVWTPLLDGFKATTEALPEMIKPALISVSAAVNEEVGKIAEREVAHADAIAKAAKAAMPKKPGALDTTKDKADYKLASAVEIGSKEASSIIARSTSAGARQATLAAKGVQAQQATADNTAKMVEHMKNMNALAIADRFVQK